MSNPKVFVADKATQDQIKANTDDILSELKGQRPKRYGFRIKITEPDPTARVEYLYDAVGMTPAAMNFTTGGFNYGSWKDIWFLRDNYPCMVNYDGTEAYKLNPDNYTLKASDGTASDVSNTAYGGNAMAAIPLCWVKRYEEDGYQYVIICETQYDEGYKAFAHTLSDGTIGKLYMPMFKGSLIESKLRSISGQRPQNTTTAEAERTAAKANGAAWDIREWASWQLIGDLLVLISKSCNSQAAFGQGNTTSGSAAQYILDTGTLNDKGQFFGYSDTTHQVKVMHMEGMWGDRWDRIVGLMFSGGVFRAKMTPEGAGYNFTGAGYAAVDAGVTAGASGNGWQRETKQTEFGRLPIAPFTGSEATFETDYFWWNSGIVAAAVVGGYCDSGAYCGCRSLCVDNPPSRAYWAFGASPSLKVPS